MILPLSFQLVGGFSFRRCVLQASWSALRVASLRFLALWLEAQSGGLARSCIFPLVFIFAAASIYSWLLNHACSSFACLCEFEYGKPSFSVAQCPCMYGRSWVASCSVVVCGSSSWFTDLCKCSTSLLETLVCLTGPCWSSAIAYICCSSCRSPSWSRSSKYVSTPPSSTNQWWSPSSRYTKMLTCL